MSCRGILPGQTKTGFKLLSFGLPTIRDVKIQPFIDWDNASDQLSDPDKLPELLARLTFTTKTVGPEAPPADFKIVDFLQTIASYKEEALKLGWIDNAGVANSLDVKINAAMAALQGGHNNTARNILNALLNEVDAQSGKHLSSEAVALLKFNTLFLVSKIS